MTRQKLTCLIANVAMLNASYFAGGRLAAHPVVLESAEMGAPGRISGTSITTAQFVGWRFTIDRPLAVDRVGGHMLAIPEEPGDLFAALVRLDSLTSVPHGAPFTGEEVVTTTLFRPNFPSDEYLTPLSATLLPGSYALVFGTGLFGATGFGALPNGPDQTDIPPTNLSSFIYWSRPTAVGDFEWRLNLASHIRVVIEAQTIHIPGDYDLNGVVDDADFEVWKTDFGSVEVLDADGNGDTIVDAADYTIWRDNLGSRIADGTVLSIVPEPAAAAIVVQVMCLLTAVFTRQISNAGSNARI